MIKNGWGAKSLRQGLEVVLSQVPKNDWGAKLLRQALEEVLSQVPENDWGSKSLRRDLEEVLSQVPKNDWGAKLLRQALEEVLSRVPEKDWGVKSLRRDLEEVLSQVPKKDWKIEFVEKKSGIDYGAYGYPPLIVSKAYNLVVKGECVLSAVYRVHDRRYVIEGNYRMRQPEGYTYAKDGIRLFQATEDVSLFPSRIYAVLQEMYLGRSDDGKYDQDKYLFLIQLEERISKIVNCKKEFIR